MLSFLGPIGSGMIVLVRIPEMCEIDLFKNYSYSLGLLPKRKEVIRKNIRMNAIP